MKFEFDGVPTVAQLKAAGLNEEQARQALRELKPEIEQEPDVVEAEVVDLPEKRVRNRVIASTRPEDLNDSGLGQVAAILSDIEEVRKANKNRILYLTSRKPATDKDGNVVYYPDGSVKMWGAGLDGAFSKSVEVLESTIAQVTKLEQETVYHLEFLMRAHPLGPFVKNTNGLGYKTVARLLGQIGDPYWHAGQNRPRLLSELWQYCGHGSESRRKRGEQATWSPEAKKRTWVAIEPAVKSKPYSNRYRSVYDTRRAETADRLHAKECAPCKAKPGEPWKPGHQHADAMRLMGKELLRDLWLEARRIHKDAR